MRVLNDETIFEGDFLRLIRRRFVDRAGKEKDWEMVERVRTYGRVVVIIALTDDNEIILGKMFRVPLGGYILDVPAGLSDKEGEKEEDTARRELLEETGYKVRELKHLINFPADAGLQKGELSFYLGKGARKVKESQLEDAEEIEVSKVPLDKLKSYIEDAKKSKVRIDIKLAAALTLL